MKLRLPLSLRTALVRLFSHSAYLAKTICSKSVVVAGATAALAFLPAYELGAQSLNIFILTGQSNAEGAVKGYPLTPSQLQEYASDDVLFWYRNVNNYSSASPSYLESSAWGQAAPQEPLTAGSLCMGPEYGFSYMMEKKGWMVSDSENVAIVKAALNGGGDSYWMKGNIAYNNILTAVTNALASLDRNVYTTVNIAGLLYLQGESGVTQGRYAQLVANLQSDLSAAGYQGVTVSLEDQSILGQPSQGAGTSILKDYVDTHSSTAKWVITDDLKVLAADNGLHFSGSAQLSIGARYAYSAALFNGLDVGFVRGQEKAALDTAEAWWGGAAALAGLASHVAEWDLSSSNTTHSISAVAGKKLEVGGIRIADTYMDNTTTTLQGGHAASATDAATGTTLSVGASGIAVGGVNENGGKQYQYSRNLVIASNLEIRADQDWILSGGSSLTVRGDSSDSASPFHKAVLSGSGNVHLKRLAGTTGTASFRLNQADGVGTARTWTMSDGVNLSLNASSAWSSNSFVLESGAKAGMGGETGSLSIGGLSLGDNSQLVLGGGASSNVSLTTGALTVGAGGVLVMDVGSLGHDSLIYSGDSPLAIDGLKFDFVYGSQLDETVKITILQNAGNLTGFTWNETVSDSLTSRLELVGGDLVLSFVGSGSTGSVTWAEYSPGGDALVADAAVFVAKSKVPGITGGTLSLRTSSVQSGVALGQYYTLGGTYTGDVYGVVDGVVYTTWAGGMGTGSGSNFASNNLNGNVYLKVTGDMKGATIGGMIGVLNSTVNGNVYMEFDAENVTTAYNSFGLGSISGAYNALIKGGMTIVVKSGTHRNDVKAGSGASARNIEGGTVLRLEGGTYKANV